MFQTVQISPILEIRILDLPALLSRFCVTLSAMSPDPPAKIKIVSFGRNYLTG
jgi:hypothetical protein